MARLAFSGHLFRHMRQGAKIAVVGVQAVGLFPPRSFGLRSPQAGFDDAGYLVGDLILKIEDAVQRAIEFVCPELPSGSRLRATGR